MARNKDITETRLQLEPYQVILRPIVTEKGFFNSNQRNTYTFEVNKLASKEQIKKAVEELFEVKVVNVTTQNRQGKLRRTRRSVGRTKSWKKAMVTLDPESRIDIAESALGCIVIRGCHGDHRISVDGSIFFKNLLMPHLIDDTGIRNTVFQFNLHKTSCRRRTRFRLITAGAA